MTGRDSLLVLGALVLATGIAALLLVGTFASPEPGEGRPRFFVNFEGRPVPSARPALEVERNVPLPFRAVLPFQRGVSEGARDAAAYLLVLLGVSAALVLGRDQVLAAYHAARGGWRAQLRVFATGVAVLLVLASAIFLGAVALLGTIAEGFRGVPTGIQFGLQLGFTTASALVAVFALVALVGFTATSWRLGDGLFASRPFAAWGQRVPGALVALIGATILYLLAQLPVVGFAFRLAIIAYALGIVVVARLAPGTTAPARP